MMESFSIRCPECGGIPTGTQKLCESCYRDRNRKGVYAFQSDLMDLYDKHGDVDAMVDSCQTLRNYLTDWLRQTSDLLTDLDEYCYPSDSCVPRINRTNGANANE